MVIPGLLEHENLSGYDIKKRIDHSISFFWKGSCGSIYPALNAMEKEGLTVRANDRENETEREKSVYAITDAGSVGGSSLFLSHGDFRDGNV